MSDTRKISRVTKAAPGGLGTRRILLLDGRPMVREWLSAVIAKEHDLCVCGMATDFSLAIPQLEKLRPHLAIMDIAQRDCRGANALAVCRAQFKDLPVLVYSGLEEEAHAEVAIRAGASGFINHQATGTEVIAAIRRVLGGGVSLHATIAERILTHFVQGRRSPIDAPDELLSPREYCVFEQLGEGYRPSEIAARMNLAISTVENYMARMEAKLALPTSRELVRAAIAWMRARGRSGA